MPPTLLSAPLLALTLAAPALAGLPPPGTPPRPDELARVVRRNTVDLTRCYQRVARRDPTLEGAKLQTRLSIDAAGRVEAVRFTAGADEHQDLGDCLAGAIKRWAFPPAGHDYGFEFPILLVGN